MRTAKPRKAAFGNVRRLPSGRYQARYTDPRGRTRNGPVTFDAKGDAQSFLATVRADLVRGQWRPPRQSVAPTFADYARPWLADRPLRPRTRAGYHALLDRFLLPAFGEMPLPEITPERVRRWHAELGPSRPTQRAHAYALLRSVLASAVRDQVLAANPCHIRGAGSARRVHRVEPATLEELATLTAAMPSRYRLLVLLASWCALRFGELAELRRADIDLRNKVVRVRRAVARAGHQVIVGAPKTAAGSRDVAIPPHLMLAVRGHLREHTGPDKGDLLFPAADGGHLATSTLYGVFWRARAAAGRPDLRFHDLRHTGAVLAASTGATLAELMARLGHSTPSAALRYQHAAKGRDRAIAEALSALAEGSPR